MMACRQKSMRWFDIYTDVSEEEATRLLAAAGQAELRKMEPLAGGWANSTYLLTLDDDSQLVLKLWNNKTPIEVERIIRNTCWLADHGVPTPIPLLLKDGERMLVVNDLSWMLMPYIAGGWLPTDPSSLHDIGQGTGPVAPDSSIRRYPSHFVIWTRILGETYRRCRRTGSACTFCSKIKERISNTQTENSRRPSARTYPRRPESRKCNRKEGEGSGTARS